MIWIITKNDGSTEEIHNDYIGKYTAENKDIKKVGLKK